jgi:polysaccharide biosynthesis/export protein
MTRMRFSCSHIRRLVTSFAATSLLAICVEAAAQTPKPGATTAPGSQSKPRVTTNPIDAPSPTDAKPVERPRPPDAAKAAGGGVPGVGASSKGYALGTGDVVRMTVFQQPDMTTETRVSETGTITIPLLGPVDVAGLTSKQVESRIGDLLKAKGFVRDPQINLTVVQFKSRQVSVLGHVNRPGRYSLEEGAYYVTDLIAIAGGQAADAADTVTLVRLRDGNVITLQLDIPALFRSNGALSNPEAMGGDTIYVDRYPVFYVYGEVQRPGVYRLEKGMTLMQALALGGGLNLRASKKDIQMNRRDRDGKLMTFTAQLTDLILPDDVVFVKESLF